MGEHNKLNIALFFLFWAQWIWWSCFCCYIWRNWSRLKNRCSLFCISMRAPKILVMGWYYYKINKRWFWVRIFYIFRKKILPLDLLIYNYVGSRYKFVKMNSWRPWLAALHYNFSTTFWKKLPLYYSVHNDVIIIQVFDPSLKILYTLEFLLNYFYRDDHHYI